MSYPDVAEALPDFGSSLIFRVAKKTVKDGLLTQADLVDVQFEGVIEPIPPRKLLIKPEGQRSWRWWTLWTTQPLTTDSVIIDDEDVPYNVMSKTDWSRNGGYFEYELAQKIDETGSPA